MNSAQGSKEVPTTPLSHQVDAFLDHCIDQNLSLMTLDTYSQVLARFTKWMQEHHPDVVSVSQIEVQHLQHFRRHLREATAAKGKEMSLTTQAKYLAVLRSLLRYYALEGKLTVISRDQVKLPKATRPAPGRRLTGEELDKLLAQADTNKIWGLRDRAIMALLAATGLKVSELCALNRRDLKPRGGDAVLESVPQGEGDATFLDALTLSYLNEYLQRRQDSYAPMFIRHKPGKPLAADDPNRLTRQMVDRMLAKYARTAGLELIPSARDLARTGRR